MKAVVLRKPWLLLQLAALTWCYRADVDDLSKHQARSEVGPEYLLERVKSAARLRVRIRRTCRELGLPVPDFFTPVQTPVHRTARLRETIVRRVYNLGTVAALAGAAALFWTKPAHAWDCGTGGTTRWDEGTNTCQPIPAAPAPAAAPATPNQQQRQEASGYSQSSASAGGANTRLGVSGDQVTSRSLALGFVLPPVAGLVQMAPVACPLPTITQETAPQYAWGAYTGQGKAMTDPKQCVITDAINDAIRSCHFLTAKRLRDAQLRKMLDNYTPTGEDGYEDLTAAECEIIRAPKAAPVPVGIATTPLLPADPADVRTAPTKHRKPGKPGKRRDSAVAGIGAGMPRAGDPCGEGKRWTLVERTVMACEAQAVSR